MIFFENIVYKNNEPNSKNFKDTNVFMNKHADTRACAYTHSHLGGVIHEHLEVGEELVRGARGRHVVHCG